jgi:NAD(P)-dependent dehydrogenase (short-subunit alcohol dehydrogenase family)
MEQLEQEAAEIRQAGGAAWTVRADLGVKEDCRQIIQETVDQFGRIDALVNNGGMIEPIAPIADADIQDWEQNWAVNVLAPVILTQMALPQLRMRQGRILNITSGAAGNTIGGWGAYISAKTAINQITQILASEEPEITALAVRPGIVDTRMQAAIRQKGKGRMAERNYQQLYNLYETGKLLPPEDPSRAIAILALYAPHEWSGEIVQWDEARVQELSAGHFPPGPGVRV